MAKTPRKPRSDKKAMAAETRSAILRAAQALFAAKGFFDTTIADIVKAAGVSRGTFYLYFKDRGDVFATLLSQAVDEMFLLSASRQTGSRRERIESANRAYLETFRRHRAFMRSALQVATFDPRVAEALSALRGKFIARIRAHLERAVARGECHDIDPAITSFLLVIMVEFTAYSWLSFGWQPDQGEFEVDAIVREASALWARAVYK